MGGRLHQINLTYRADEDRLVLKVNTVDRAELRLWLTRRVVKTLWAALQGAVEGRVAATAPAATPAARKALAVFAAEAATPRKNFAKSFDAAPAAYPLGKAPALVVAVRYEPPPPRGKAGRLAFRTGTGAEIGLPADDAILHSLGRMLAAIAPRTGWGLQLDSGPAPGAEAKPARLN